MRVLMVILLLASEGCASFAFSRFSPQPSDAPSNVECSDWPAFADGMTALLLGIGGLTLDGLSRPVDPGCSQDPGQAGCYVHFKYYIPAMIAAASMMYGITAYAVCSQRIAHASRGDWRPRVENAKAPP